MPSSVIITLIIIVAVSFVIMLIGVTRSFRQVRQYRRDVIRRIKSLRIDKMLSRAGISRARFLRKAQPSSVEKHLLFCKYCSTTDICDKYLEQGEDIPEHTFCPNFRELTRYR